MKIIDFINLVKDGPLRQVSINQTDLVSYINLGLQEVYQKFNLDTKTETITLTTALEYDLPLDFTSVNYIRTSGNYYRDEQGNLYNLNEDFDLAINEPNNFNSIFINNNLTLYVPYPVVGQELTLNYKASPVLIAEFELDTDMLVANQYLNPLMMYVTYLGFLQNGGSSIPEIKSSLQLYEEACNSILMSGNYINHTGYDNKFEERGFV
jgi:hypothetical protein